MTGSFGYGAAGTSPPDIRVQDHGTLILLCPASDAGEKRLRDNAAPDAPGGAERSSPSRVTSPTSSPAPRPTDWRWRDGDRPGRQGQQVRLDVRGPAPRGVGLHGPGRRQAGAKAGMELEGGGPDALDASKEEQKTRPRSRRRWSPSGKPSSGTSRRRRGSGPWPTTSCTCGSCGRCSGQTLR